MNILVVEDDPFVLKDIIEMLKLLGYSKLETTDNYDDAIQMINKTPPQMALLDINLVGEKTGIEIGAVLNRKKIPFIYLSDVQDIDTFEMAKKTNPSANLDKPISLIQLRNAISLGVANEIKITPEKKYIIVPLAKRKIKINAEDVMYLKAAQNNCEIHLENHDVNRLLSSTPMGNVIKILNESYFCQVHRSYTVNLNKVHSFEGKRVFLDKDQEIAIPIGDSYLNGFKSKFLSV